MTMQQPKNGDWPDTFPELRGVDDPAWRSIRKSARLVTLPPGTRVFRDGDACGSYVLVLKGRVRVQKVSEGGREIVLYRVGAGQGCVLTTSCLLAGKNYPAEAVAETEVRAVVIPAREFDRGLAESPGFRHFVFSNYGRRLAELIMLVEDVAFGRVGERLAQSLLEHADGADSIAATHQTLAVELGTAREVVSRQLKEFERRGWVRLHRGRVDILDADALRALTENAAM
jgi:CRP/FNR family transcriptional regulator